MAEDAIGLMDALGIKSAHVVGGIDGRHDRPGNGDLVSAAGALADLDHVDHRRSPCAAAKPRGHRHTDGAAAGHQGRIRRALRPDLEGVARRQLPAGRSARSRPRRTQLRAWPQPGGVARQLRAILASGSRKQRLGSVTAPTLVIHGTVDPLVRPEGGQDTAASIPGAKLLMVEGMGHALPIPMWPQVIDAIDRHAMRLPRQRCIGLKGRNSPPKQPCRRRKINDDRVISWSRRASRRGPPWSRTCPGTARRSSDRR